MVALFIGELVRAVGVHLIRILLPGREGEVVVPAQYPRHGHEVGRDQGLDVATVTVDARQAGTKLQGHARGNPLVGRAEHQALVVDPLETVDVAIGGGGDDLDRIVDQVDYCEAVAFFLAAKAHGEELGVRRQDRAAEHGIGEEIPDRRRPHDLDGGNGVGRGLRNGMPGWQAQHNESEEEGVQEEL